MAEVPEVEDFFDITVTLAASPSNFTVSFFFKLLLIFLSLPSKSIVFLSIIIFGILDILKDTYKARSKYTLWVWGPWIPDLNEML